MEKLIRSLGRSLRLDVYDVMPLQVLVSELIRTVPIKPGDVFLDMGSGVGQVTLQVAAEVDLKHSYGIELRDIPASVRRLVRLLGH